MAVNRNVSYLNRDFNSFRSSLINFSQTYFPNTYTDFSPASPGVMFMEQAAYVGDVLSFYLDNQVQENFVQYARQTDNLYDLAYMFGYKPRVTGLATADVEVFQLVPAKASGSYQAPDFDYTVTVEENTVLTSNDARPTNFLIENPIDFSISSSEDPTEVSVAQTSGGNPTYYLLKKTRPASSGTITTSTFSFGAAEEFPTITINATNISHIIDIVDSDGNTWYEVDYLGQDFVYDRLKNTNVNDPNNSSDAGDTPYILKLKKIQRRFVTRFLDNETLQIQFGSGDPSLTDEEIIPNPNNVGLGLPQGVSKLNTAYSPVNFIFSNSYGIAPSNTTLTVRYLTGGGVAANVAANSLTTINTANTRFNNASLNAVTAQYVFDSIAVNNPGAADGGRAGDSVEELRNNIAASYGTQLRAVTTDDYTVRALSMPSEFGVIAKAHVQKPNLSDQSSATVEAYVLSYDINKNLQTASTALKRNLKTYLNQYRMVGDSVEIKNAFVINIGVSFEIITLPNVNNNEVLTNCLNSLRDHFNIDNWAINQPILLSRIRVMLDQIAGVQTVRSVTISNKAGTSLGYSQYAYDINSATQNDIVYPSIDPSIFEVKNPNVDITGRIVTM